MDHVNSGGPPTVRAQNFYQLCTISLFVYKIPFYTYTHTHALLKVVEAEYERMKDQSN
jgi:hypothetical protein